MCGEHNQILEAGSDLVFIGSGSIEQAARFKNECQVKFELLVDPSLRVYETTKMKRSIRKTFHWKSIKSYWRAYWSGFRVGWVQGDSIQQGGTVVVLPKGLVSLLYVSEFSGDYANIKAILQALKKKVPQNFGE